MFRKMGMTVALLGASIGAVAMAAPVLPEIRAITDEAATSPRPVRRRRLAAQAAPARRRSRGPQAKPKRRSNMKHVSRLVRRKHRRAA